jgi:LemA protein
MGTSLILLIVLLAVGVIAVYGITLYNRLIQVKHNVDQAWSNIDVLLKQRHDELPKLLVTVKSYMVYEKDLMERLTQLRARTGTGATDPATLQAEGALSAGLGRLFAVAENYPDLKANQNFLQLQQRMSAIEEQIAHRREFYNESVNINNVRMEQFPDSMLTGMAGLARRSLFEATPQEKADVAIGDRLRL